MEKVLVLGSGGRESSLIHAHSKSPHVGGLYAIPGNDSMQDLTDKPVEIFPQLKTTDKNEIVALCKDKKITFVDIAQDNAVEAGLANTLAQEGILHIGPTREAGQLEWDKGWAREFMKKNAIPHPAFAICNSVKEGALFLDEQDDQPWVIKAAGLAEGKGVILVQGRKDAKKAIEKIQKHGEIYLIEQMLMGEEFSMFAISDGENYQIIGNAQDNKKVYDHDEGPNTGGMGANTPSLLVTQDVMKEAQDILDKTFQGMNNIGRPYQGVLYLGGIVTSSGVKVIEVNARWGDPEAQVIVPGIMNDFYELSTAVALGTIGSYQLQIDHKVRVAIAGTSRGYPEDYSAVAGKEISGLNEAAQIEGVTIYGAGIKKRRGKNYAQGGRLFYVVGEGGDIIQARAKAYEAMELVRIEENGLHYRKDIGWRDVLLIRRGK